MTIGERIKQRRIELGLSQEELSRKMGYKTRNAIYQFEQKDNMKLSLVEKFAEALETTPSYLMGWEEQDGLISVNLDDFPQASMEQLKEAFAFYKRLNRLSPEKRAALLTLLEVPQNDV